MEISFDPARLDLGVVHDLLTNSYWSPGIPRETVARAIAGSLCVGAYAGDGGQIGFSRIVTDRATFAYLADVIVAEAARVQGAGQAMIRALMDHPDVQGMHRWLLATEDAHGVYAKLGWTALAHPEWFMEIVDRDIYRR